MISKILIYSSCSFQPGFFLIYQEETKNITVEETCQTCGSIGIMNMASKVLQNPSYWL